MSRGVPRVQAGCCLGQSLCGRRLGDLSWVWLCLQDPLPFHRLSWERGLEKGTGATSDPGRLSVLTWAGRSVQWAGCTLSNVSSIPGFYPRLPGHTSVSVTIVPRTLPHGPRGPNLQEQPQKGSAIEFVADGPGDSVLILSIFRSPPSGIMPPGPERPRDRWSSRGLSLQKRPKRLREAVPDMGLRARPGPGLPGAGGGL